MDIGEMKVSEILKLTQRLQGGKSHSLQAGVCYFIRTVTYHYTGRLQAVTAAAVMSTESQ